MKKRTRWAVVFPKERRYISNRGGIAWTYDRTEAKELAGTSGVVVDADDFAANWAERMESLAAAFGKGGGR